jgi:dihydroorotase
VGLETSFPLAYTELVLGGVLDFPTLVRKMSTAPAELLKLPGGSLAVGCLGDVTVLDLDEQWTIDKRKFHSKCLNTPFHGREVTGRALATVVAGRVVWRLNGN